MMEETRPPSEISERSFRSVRKDHSSSHAGHSFRWPEWDACESFKCKDSSGWSSWECSQAYKDMHNFDTINREVLTVADSSFGQSFYFGFCVINTGQGMEPYFKTPSEISERNAWHVTKGHHDGHSHRWPDLDACESLTCKDSYEWTSWECNPRNKDMHKDDTTDRGVHTFSHSSFNEQGGRVWKSRGREWDRGLCWEKSSWERESSRRRGRDNSMSRSRSPCNGRLIEKGSTLDVIRTRCRDFSAGKCFRGNQCKFLHQDYLKIRDRDHPRNELIERLRYRAVDGSAGGPRDNIYDSSADYCEEDESRKNTLCCKDFPKGKCFKKQSHRYFPLKFAGEDGERVNKRAFCDQNVNPLANTSDTDPCKFFPAGKLAYHYINNIKASRNDPTATDDATCFSDNAKVACWGEDTQKSLNADEGLSEITKAITSWDRLPASSVKHTVSHDPASKRWEGGSKGNYSHVFADVEKYDDGNSTHSFVHMGVENAGSGWNENVTIKNENRFSPLRNDCNDADTTIELSGSTRSNEGEKSKKQGEVKKHSYSDPTYDDLACSLDDPEVSGWGGRSTNDRDWHNLTDAKKPSQNNLVKMNCEMAMYGQDKKVVEEDEYLLSCTQNGSESADKGTCNPLASKKIGYKREQQLEVQGSEPGGFVLPPSSLSVTNQSCHAVSTNPLNGLSNILDESVTHKLSFLVNQMQTQFDEAIKILEMWARQNTVTADLDVRLSKLQTYLSPTSVNGQQNPPGNISGVHLKSNEVWGSENLESSDPMLKKQEPVGYAEVKENIIVVNELNGNKGELCKQEGKNTHSARDAQYEAGGSSPDEKSMFLFRNALVKLVKEILKPVLMERQIKLEVHDAIVKKAVDKVISFNGVHIPKTQEHTDRYLSISKPGISTLVNDYVMWYTSKD